MGHKKPEKIDVDQALSGETPLDGGGDDGDDIEIVEVVAGEPERSPDPTLAGAHGDGIAESQAQVEAGEAGTAGSGPQEEALLERLKRVQAEYENFRKRVERDRVEHREQANAKLVRNLLPVLDSFERAMKNGTEAKDGEFRMGIELIHRQLREALFRAGLEPLQAQGEMFDPEVHEAVATSQDPGAKPGQILDVFEQGYRFRGRLLRPARVRVAAAPEGS